jgi:hypothetical protein
MTCTLKEHKRREAVIEYILSFTPRKPWVKMSPQKMMDRLYPADKWGRPES